jgi:hypothetical protein
MHSDFFIFCSFFLFTCLPMFGVIAGVMWNHHFAHQTLHWPRTRGVIEESSVRTVGSDAEKAPTRYFVEVRYAYAVGKSTLRSDEIWLNSEHETKTYEDAELLSERYFVGRDVTTFFNPKNPAQAVLDPGFHSDAYLPLFRNVMLYALAPALTLLLGLFSATSQWLAHFGR